MSEAKRRLYTEEFKSEAVRLVAERNTSVAAVARELGIHENVLSRWCREDRQATPIGMSRPALKAEAEELVRLRRENEILRKERDFLRSAAAYFARERK